ncbi:MAG: IS1380 family transposase [candidate division Zixibacteria bacterium]|nr:IS1380 family transposase [candidate division Zixibacteria bacterium]
MTECNQSSFSYFVKKNLTADFKGGEISSDSGLLLLRQLDQELGLTKGLGDCIDDERHQSYTKQPILDLIRQRTYQIMAGYEDANDADELRHDPILKSVTGRLLSDEPLASQPTISRFENGVTFKEIFKLLDYLLDFYISNKSKDTVVGSSPLKIIIDADSTDAPVCGNQQLSLFHGYYGNYIYHPLLIYDGDTGELITAVLRPDNAHASRRIVAILRRIIKKLKEAFKDVEITFRADGGFAIPDLYEFCESESIDYIIGFITNNRVLACGEKLRDTAKEKYCETQTKQRLFDDFDYQANSWDMPLRIIIKAEHNDKGSNHRFVATNMTGTPERLYDFYALRGDCENRIKEFKERFKGWPVKLSSFCS